MRLITFIRKFKILHILFWLYAILSLAHTRSQQLGERLGYSLPDIMIIVTAQALCVYSIVYFLLPRFLRKKKYLAFTGLSILSILGYSILTSLAQDLYTLLTEGVHLRNLLIITFTQFVDMSVTVAVFLGVVVVADLYESDQLNKKLEKEKLEAELNFLKAQVNPHFLFNTLNNIYVLIDIDKKLAGDTVLKLSQLLRYQLYECKEPKVFIKDELRFLKAYIELEKARFVDTTEVDCSFPESVPDFLIAPILLVPVVENAFKHFAPQGKQKGFISIKAQLDDNIFNFTVANTYDMNARNNVMNDGIGLENVMKRLELIYPSKHKISIDKTNSIFTVNLRIYAYQDEVHYS